jgi:hypothetical protein
MCTGPAIEGAAVAAFAIPAPTTNAGIPSAPAIAVAPTSFFRFVFIVSFPLL